MNEIKDYIIFTNKSNNKNAERKLLNYAYDDTIYDDVVYTNDCKELHIKRDKADNKKEKDKEWVTKCYIFCCTKSMYFIGIKM